MEDGTSLDDLRAAAQNDVRALRWADKPVSDDLLRAIFDITIMGPTSMNTCPSRIKFVKSKAAKERLATSLKPANVPKVMSAPVTAIIAYDLDFWTHLPKLFPHEDRRHFFEGKDAHIADTAFRNSTLQGAYFMIAARALGLDVGAISGFDNAALFQRLPRFDFDDVCEIL